MPAFVHSFLPYILAILTTLIWAGNAVIARALEAELPPVSLAFWRWVFAFLIFLPFTWRAMKRDWPVIQKNFWILVLMAIPGIAFYNTFVYIALQTTVVANTTLTVCAAPAFILLLSRLFFNEKISLKNIIGLAFSFFGVTYILMQGNLTNILSFKFGQGEFWALGAALSWATYSVLLRKRPAQIGQKSFVSVTFIIGIVILAPFALLESYLFKPFPITTNSIMVIAYVSIFASVLAYLMWNRTVALIGSAHAGIFLYLFPIFASFGAALFLGEPLYFYHLIGVLFVIIGIGLIIRLPKPQNKPSI